MNRNVVGMKTLCPFLDIPTAFYLPPFLRSEVAAYRAAAFSDNTKKAYNVHLSEYMRFCASMNLKPVPASRDQVCWYAAYLACRLKPSSIKQYLNIVRLLHIEGGHINPCQDNWQLQSTLKGIERLLGSPVQRRSPTDPALLLRIKSVLNDSVLDSHFWLPAWSCSLGCSVNQTCFRIQQRHFTEISTL